MENREALERSIEREKLKVVQLLVMYTSVAP